MDSVKDMLLLLISSSIVSNIVLIQFFNSITLQKVACLRQLIQVRQFMAFLYFLSHYFSSFMLLQYTF